MSRSGPASRTVKRPKWWPVWDAEFEAEMYAAGTFRSDALVILDGDRSSWSSRAVHMGDPDTGIALCGRTGLTHPHRKLLELFGSVCGSCLHRLTPPRGPNGSPIRPLTP